MKLLLSLAISLLSVNAFACVEEAQFISEVRSVEMISNAECKIELAIDLNKENQQYSPSYMCPLHIDEVYDGAIYSNRCNYKVGDEISGYLVKKNDRIELD